MSNRRFAEHMLILKQNEGAEKEDILYLSLDLVNPGLRIASSDLWTWNDCYKFSLHLHHGYRLVAQRITPAARTQLLVIQDNAEHMAPVTQTARQSEACFCGSQPDTMHSIASALLTEPEAVSK